MAGERILIVEDEPIVARDLEASLKKMGYEVAGVARAGAEAMAKAVQTQPDLVLMDITLDGGDDDDGVQTAEAILRRLETKILYLTAHSERSMVQRAQATSPAGYVIKPFLYEGLQEALRKAFAGSAEASPRSEGA